MTETTRSTNLNTTANVIGLNLSSLLTKGSYENTDKEGGKALLTINTTNYATEHLEDSKGKKAAATGGGVAGSDAAEPPVLCGVDASTAETTLATGNGTDLALKAGIPVSTDKHGAK